MSLLGHGPTVDVSTPTVGAAQRCLLAGPSIGVWSPGEAPSTRSSRRLGRLATPNMAADSLGAIVDRNQIGRTAPDVPDTFGFGVEVDPGSAAAVTCNTFSGWRFDFDPAGVVKSQPVCVTTTTLPDGTVKVPYSAKLTAVGGTAPYTWSRVSGSLPPGLALAANGTVSGTPTKEGIYDFTVKVTDAKGETATQALTIVISAPPRRPRRRATGSPLVTGGCSPSGPPPSAALPPRCPWSRR